MSTEATLRICRSCNYFGTEPERYCPLCGTRLISECRACASPISNPFARYCANCGGKLAGPQEGREASA